MCPGYRSRSPKGVTHQCSEVGGLSFVFAKKSCMAMPRMAWPKTRPQVQEEEESHDASALRNPISPTRILALFSITDSRMHFECAPVGAAVKCSCRHGEVIQTGASRRIQFPPMQTYGSLFQFFWQQITPQVVVKRSLCFLYIERERETHSVVSLSICFNSLAHGCHLTLCENARDSVRKRSRRSRFVRSPTLSPVRFAGTHLTPLGLARSKRPLSRPWARSRRPAVHGRRLPELP